MFLAEIIVKFKKNVKNPEEKTLETLISRLDFQEIETVSCSKLYNFKIKTKNKSEALKIANELAKKVLSNPIIEEFEVKICELQ
jgi:phosphoribosylformylglycinamidine synthase